MKKLLPKKMTYQKNLNSKRHQSPRTHVRAPQAQNSTTHKKALRALRVFVVNPRIRFEKPTRNVSSPWPKSREAMRRGFEPGSRRRDDAVLDEIRASSDNEEPGSKPQA